MFESSSTSLEQQTTYQLSRTKPRPRYRVDAQRKQRPSRYQDHGILAAKMTLRFFVVTRSGRSTSQSARGPM